MTAYCLMPNHWHLLRWPRRDGELSEVLRWLTATHTQRRHAQHKTAGIGPVSQGRFKSFPVQTDDHVPTVARYGARTALRAKLVKRAEEWQGGSLWRREQNGSEAHDRTEYLAGGPSAGLGGAGEPSPERVGVEGAARQRPMMASL